MLQRIKPFVFFVIFVVAVYFVLPNPGLKHDYSRLVTFNNGQVMRVWPAEDGIYRVYTPIQDIDPLMVKATVAVEDRFFWYHWGVNPAAVLRAFIQDITSQRIVSGASTITMQVARILKRRPRTLWSKVMEMFEAMGLELHHSKKEILEYYLNHAPYGGNIEGVGAASLFYFGKWPSELTPAEVAYLVSIPRNPAGLRPSLTNASRIRHVRNLVLKQMLKRGLIAQKLYKEGLNQVVVQHKKGFEPYNYLIADFVKKLSKDRRIQTTIDPRLQDIVIRLFKSYIKKIRLARADDAAVIVVENRSAKVRALIGSIDYFAPDFGQYPVFLAPRSSGSTLKPFLYLLGIQRGLILPGSMLIDIPVISGPYRPTNFYNRYQGLIRADSALSRSKNLPFIYLLDEVGVDNFVEFLTHFGLHPNEREYSLGSIIGGIRVSLWDLSAAYSSLARLGVCSKLLILKKNNPVFKRIADRGSVYLAIQALRLRGRPDAPALRDLEPARIYWKTGTSQGRRDAWCMGFNRQYTVGVWIGKVIGRGYRKITGAGIAAPLMFDIIEAITNDKGDIHRPADDLRKQRVCSFSGYAPTSACKHTEYVDAPKAHPLLKKCPYHRVLWVEKDTGFRACPGKHYDAGKLTKKSGLVLPVQIASLLGVSDKAMPVYGPDCAVKHNGVLNVVSPISEKTYMIGPQASLSLKAIPLKGDRVLWFYKGNLIGIQTKDSSITFRPPEGRIHLSAVDDYGNTAHIDFNVKYIKDASSK